MEVFYRKNGGARELLTKRKRKNYFETWTPFFGGGGRELRLFFFFWSCRLPLLSLVWGSGVGEDGKELIVTDDLPGA